MSDAAIAADSGSAPVDGAPIPTDAPSHTPALSSQGPEAQPEPSTEVSVDASLDRAMAKVEKAAKVEPKADAKPLKEAVPVKPEAAKPEAKPAPERGEGGKFVSAKPAEHQAPQQAPEAKPSHTAGDPPARFTKDVKDIWATLPDNVRGEVSRMERELTQGYEKHRQAADRDAGIAEYHEMAAKHGTTVKDALANYVGMENLIRQNPVKGLEQVCTNMGISLRDIAAHVLNQKPEEIANDQSATIRELRQELAGIKQQLGSVSQTVHTQQAGTVEKEVTAFRADPAHPRFDELADDIAFFLKTRCPGDLNEAYKLAERLNPAPAKPQASSAAEPARPDHTDKGEKSINGAPSAGSEPAAKKRIRSIDESLDRALGAAG